MIESLYVHFQIHMLSFFQFTGTNRIQVYVYPIQKFVDEQGIPIGGMMSKEMYSILEAIVESHYYTPDPTQACILVPSIDTLNQNRFRPKQTSQALKSLP